MTRHDDPFRINRRGLLKSGAVAGAGAAGFGGLPALAAPVAGPASLRTAQRASAPGTLTIAMDSLSHELDPHSAYDYRSALALLGPYEGLIALKDDKTDEYEGRIAETWEPNADKSVWTFHIRAGITFQDGSVCDSAAILANYDRQFTLALGPIGVLGRFISDYKNQITAPDAKTVVFNLGKPQPLFEAALAASYGALIVNSTAMKSHEADGDWGHDWALSNAEGTGTGPYKITSYDPGQELVLEKYDGYWGGWSTPHFEKIVLRNVPEETTRRQLLEQGDADIVDTLTPEDVGALQSNPNLTVLRNKSTQVAYFVMTEYGPLAKPEARQAMCYAFPYVDVIQGVYKGFASQPAGGVAELCKGFAPETFKYTTDLDKARQLFGVAGIAEGTKLSAVVDLSIETTKAAIQLFQASLATIGITLDIQTEDAGATMTLMQGDAPAQDRPNVSSNFWWPDYNDAWNHLYPQVDSASWGSKGANTGLYKDDQVDQLLASAKDAPDDATYTKAMTDVQQTISKDDPPSVYYAQPEWVVVFQKNVQGVVFNPINVGTYVFQKMSRAAS
jgi:peptide/nickel transport system substrate-binding protein